MLEILLSLADWIFMTLSGMAASSASRGFDQDTITRMILVQPIAALVLAWHRYRLERKRMQWMALPPEEQVRRMCNAVKEGRGNEWYPL